MPREKDQNTALPSNDFDDADLPSLPHVYRSTPGLSVESLGMTPAEDVSPDISTGPAYCGPGGRLFRNQRNDQKVHPHVTHELA